MAAVRKKRKPKSPRRVSPLKPAMRGASTLAGARNMVAAKVRGSTYSRAAAVRFWGGISGIVFLTIFGALWLGGFMPDVKQAGKNFTQARLMSAGFVVERVDVLGEGRLAEDDVRAALKIYPGDYLFGTDLKAAKSRVESLSWVDDALVRRLWPDRIVVQIIERRPYALWQKDGHVQVVDASGEAITAQDISRYAELPLIVGEGAQLSAPVFREALATYPSINSRIDAMVRVSDTRWNLVINDRQTTIMLPEIAPEAALSKLAAMQARTQVLDREIGVIDLRIEDRVTLRPIDPNHSARNKA